MEELLDRDYIYRGRILNLRVDKVRVPNGGETIREIVEHPGAVVVVPINSKNEVLLVKQYRHAVGKDLLELPAGTLEKNEPPEMAGPRELREETGCAAGHWQLIDRFYSSPGIVTEEMHVYLATDLTEGKIEPMEDEELEVVPIPWSKALSMAKNGEIVDAKSIIGLLLAEHKLNTMAKS